jgi:hypothetical protein
MIKHSKNSISDIGELDFINYKRELYKRLNGERSHKPKALEDTLVAPSRISRFIPFRVESKKDAAERAYKNRKYKKLDNEANRTGDVHQIVTGRS